MSKKRLWDKGEAVSEAMQRFTVGNDPEIDLHILPFDILGSAAHAKMLEKINVLTSDELEALLRELRNLHKKAENGEISIPVELEDCHTTIESLLVEACGEAGKKIHTGRSRNDQVTLAVRLYLREHLTELTSLLFELSTTLLDRANKEGHTPLPGYTHMQAAMPSSVAMWLHSFSEWSHELVKDGITLLERLNSNPLGAASGFGVPLPLDREHTAELLNFDRVHRSVIDVQNSRGRYELHAIRFMEDVALLIEKISWDLILYCSKEYAFFTLPKELRTGSSIMPQKHNPDVLELLRARASKTRAAGQELLWVLAKLPSNYHRDFQYTKEPLIRAFENSFQSSKMLLEVVSAFKVNKDALETAMTPELYATYDTYRHVRDGVPFREAYKKTAADIDKLDVEGLKGDFELISKEVDKEMKELQAELLQAQKALSVWEEKCFLTDKVF